MQSLAHSASVSKPVFPKTSQCLNTEKPGLERDSSGAVAPKSKLYIPTLSLSPCSHIGGKSRCIQMYWRQTDIGKYTWGITD